MTGDLSSSVSIAGRPHSMLLIECRGSAVHMQFTLTRDRRERSQINTFAGKYKHRDGHKHS